MSVDLRLAAVFHAVQSEVKYAAKAVVRFWLVEARNRSQKAQLKFPHWGSSNCNIRGVRRHLGIAGIRHKAGAEIS